MEMDNRMLTEGSQRLIRDCLARYPEIHPCIEGVKDAFFIICENPTLGVGFKKAYSGEGDIKTPFDIISCGLPTATKKSKGGHTNERYTQFITYKMEL